MGSFKKRSLKGQKAFRQAPALGRTKQCDKPPASLSVSQAEPVEAQTFTTEKQEWAY